MKLDGSTESLATDIAFWMEAVIDPHTPIEQLGQVCLDVSTKLRAFGIVLLVTRADSSAFGHNLVRSGRVWRTYLTRVGIETAADDHHYCTGRFSPLVDSIAAGEFALARNIARLSPHQLHRGHEYEDDFCYGRLFQLMVQVDRPESEVSGVIAQFERYVAGGDNARLAMMHALVRADQEEFDEAFQSLLDANEAEIAARKAGGQLEEPAVIAQRRVFVEGLAVLRIAESRGLRTATDYDYCPSIARDLTIGALPEDDNPNLEEWLS